MVKYSFIIPCKNGLPYITSCINSVLDQEFLDCEIIVSDNHSSDGTARNLKAIFGHESRVRIISPKTPLSMAKNFDFAISAASGEWISTLGADDGVFPYFFEQMERLTALFPEAEAFVSRRAYFYWEGCEEAYGNRAILFESNSSLKRGNSEKDSIRVLRGKMPYNETLQLYAGSVVHRSLIEKVRSRDPERKLFRGSQPDIYSSSALLACDPKYFVVGAPLHWIGSSPTSNGLIQATKPQSDKASDFWAASAGQDDLVAEIFDCGSETPVHLLLMDAALLVNGHSPRYNSSVIFDNGFVGAFTNEPYKNWGNVRRSIRSTGRPESWFLAKGLAGRKINLLKRGVRVAGRAGQGIIRKRDIIILRRRESGEMTNIESANALVVEKLGGSRFL